MQQGKKQQGKKTKEKKKNVKKTYLDPICALFVSYFV